MTCLSFFFFFLVFSIRLARLDYMMEAEVPRDKVQRHLCCILFVKARHRASLREGIKSHCKGHGFKGKWRIVAIFATNDTMCLILKGENNTTTTTNSVL